jgi:release factor glutamine methyltransferase
MNNQDFEPSLLTRLKSIVTSSSDFSAETPEATLLALSFAAIGKQLSVEMASAVPLPKLDEKGKERLRALVDLRCSGIPHAHLTERQRFMGLEMLAGPQALVPRKETEILGYAALEIIRRLSQRGMLKILDVCTGSGNIIVGLLAHEPNNAGFASDLSPGAIELAKKNVAFLGLEDKVKIRCGDLFEPFDSAEFFNQVDVITCNPPYISSSKVKSPASEIYRIEPALAFDGGPYGMTIISRLIREAPKFLRRESFLCFEIGLGQGLFVEQMLKKSNLYQTVQSLTDENGEVRCLIAGT